MPYVVKIVFCLERIICNFKHLTLKAKQNWRGQHYLFLRENKTWHFIWKICNTHEITCLIFSEKILKKKEKIASAAVVISILKVDKLPAYEVHVVGGYSFNLYICSFTVRTWVTICDELLFCFSFYNLHILFYLGKLSKIVQMTERSTELCCLISPVYSCNWSWTGFLSHQNDLF